MMSLGGALLYVFTLMMIWMFISRICDAVEKCAGYKYTKEYSLSNKEDSK